MGSDEAKKLRLSFHGRIIEFAGHSAVQAARVATLVGGQAAPQVLV
jgi:hypothetical protein